MSSSTEKAPLLPRNDGDTAARRVEMPHVQGLRFVAMSWIITFHYLSTKDMSPFFQSLFGFDAIGYIVEHRPLDLFTVISGFTTHLAYGSHEKSLGAPLHFLARRSSRLIFTYYLTLTLAFFLKLVTLGVGTPSMPEIGMEYLCFILGVLGLNVWVGPLLIAAGMPQDSRWVEALIWPHNGPLWYIQALFFVWFTYPLLREYVSGPQSVFQTRGALLVQVLGWWSLGVLPALLLYLSGLYAATWLFIKVLPVFMMAPFYVGVAVCALYQHELAASSAGKKKENGKKNEDDTPESQKEEEEEGLWDLVKRGGSALIGEALFLLWVALQVLPYTRLSVHLWSVVFGFILFFLGLAAASKSGMWEVGVKWLLQSELIVLLGDASLCAFTFQFPVARIFYWIMGPLSGDMDAVAESRGMGVKQHPTDREQHWMVWYQFLPYIAGLYVFSHYLGKYVDKPVSAWIQPRLVAAVKQQ